MVLIAFCMWFPWARKQHGQVYIDVQMDVDLLRQMTQDDSGHAVVPSLYQVVNLTTHASKAGMVAFVK